MAAQKDDELANSLSIEESSSLMNYAIWTIESGDSRLIDKAVKLATKAKNESVLRFLKDHKEELKREQLHKEDKLRQKTIDEIEALSKIEYLYPHYKLLKIDRSVLPRRNAKPIQLQCNKHGIFYASIKDILSKDFSNKQTIHTEDHLCPLCRGFKSAKDRIQVNVRLDLEHSMKISGLLAYYSQKDQFNFQGNSINIAADEDFGATSLGRILLDSSIDVAYTRMMAEKRIDQVVQLIREKVNSKGEFEQINEAWDSIKSDPMYHLANASDDIRYFFKSLEHIRQSIFKTACMWWGEEEADALFDKAWDKAKKAFIEAEAKNIGNKDQRSKDLELMKEMMDLI